MVADINNAESVYDIACAYPSVSVDAFPDELNDATHELLDDASSTVAGKRAHIKEGPIKSYESCMRKVASPFQMVGKTSSTLPPFIQLP